MNQKRFKITVISIATAIVVILLTVFFFIFSNIEKTARLEILVAPASSEIKINGKSYKNGTYAFIPGTYHVEIKKEGFNSYSGEIEIKDEKENRLYHYLEQTDGSFSWYLDHKQDDSIMATIGEYEADLTATEYIKKDPILKITPYYDEENNHFSISVKNDKVTINLNACTDSLKSKYILEAQNYLKNHDLDPLDYDIDYIGLCDNI